jgi:hypothetical protein
MTVVLVMIRIMVVVVGIVAAVGLGTQVTKLTVVFEN